MLGFHWLFWIGLALFVPAFIYGLIGSFIGDYRPSAVLRVFKL